MGLERRVVCDISEEVVIKSLLGKIVKLYPEFTKICAWLWIEAKGNIQRRTLPALDKSRLMTNDEIIELMGIKVDADENFVEQTKSVDKPCLKEDSLRMHEVGYNTCCYAWVPASMSLNEADEYVKSGKAKPAQ